MSARSATAWIACFAVLVVAGLLLMGDSEVNESPSASDPVGPIPRTEAISRVTQVVDGDTVVVEVAGRDTKVRYIGVDTPESVKPGSPVQCFAKRAASFNRQLVLGRTVRLAFGLERRDRYGRLLAYVSVGGRSVNEALLRGGYARTLEIEPNTGRATRYRKLEEEAQAAGRGLWGACNGR